AQTICLDQRGQTFTEGDDVDRVLDGQQIAIPPHGLRSLLDALAADHLLERGLVVDRIERAEAHLADVSRLELVLRAALATAQPDDLGHAAQFRAPLSAATIRTSHRARAAAGAPTHLADRRRLPRVRSRAAGSRLGRRCTPRSPRMA